MCRPANGSATGGDFWGVYDRPDGTVGLLLGDVQGHGPEVTSTAQRLSKLVGSVVSEGHGAEVVMRVVRRAVERLDTTATVLFGLHDPAAQRMVFCCAGHPAPLISNSGVLKVAGVRPTPPAGAPWEAPESWAAAPVRPGETVVLYSDGLADDGGSILGHLLASMTDLSRSGAALADVCALAASAPRSDDRTVLAIRMSVAQGLPTALERHRRGATGG